MLLKIALTGLFLLAKGNKFEKLLDTGKQSACLPQQKLLEIACKKEFQRNKERIRQIRSRKKYKVEAEMARIEFNKCTRISKAKFTQCRQQIINEQVKSQRESEKARAKAEWKVNKNKEYIRHYE